MAQRQSADPGDATDTYVRVKVHGSRWNHLAVRYQFGSFSSLTVCGRVNVGSVNPLTPATHKPVCMTCTSKAKAGEGA